MERSSVKYVLAALLALNMPTSVLAECVKPVAALEQGAPAPCKGFLFSPKKELEVRLLSKESELLKVELETLNLMVDKYGKKSVEYEKIIDLHISRTELWKAKAEDITLKYVAVEESRTKRDITFILVGVGLTVLAGWSLGQVAGR
jgi:hypothetical protein